MASPSPVPPRPAAAGVVDAAKALEDVGAPLRRDAGPVVGDDQRDDAVRLGEAHRHRRGGVADGVVEQVGHDPAQLLTVADHLRRRHAAGCRPRPG